MEWPESSIYSPGGRGTANSDKAESRNHRQANRGRKNPKQRTQKQWHRLSGKNQGRRGGNAAKL
jgi:hypothetical protein